MAGYRRGLIGPYYEQGRHGDLSRIRERLVLDMLEMEELGEARAKTLDIYASVAGPHYNVKKLKEVLGHYNDELHTINALRSYNPEQAKSREERLLDSVQKLVQVYREMVATGEDKRILEQMRKKAKRK